ncbi:hypothetical protein WJX82_001507 [Trebouxia sp. C0006]
MEIELVSSVVVKHTRTSPQAWQRVIPTSQQASGWHDRDKVRGCGCLVLWRRHSHASEPTTGVTGAIPQCRRNKSSYKHLIPASGATAWTSAAACCTVETARSNSLDLVVINHATGQRQIVHWDEDADGKQPLTPTQKSFTRLYSGLVVEKISGTWKWKQVAVSDDGKALLALTSQEGLPSLWLWTSNSFTSNNVAELLKGPMQGTGFWQHFTTVPKELLSKALALAADEQQAAGAEQSLQQQSLCISFVQHSSEGASVAVSLLSWDPTTTSLYLAILLQPLQPPLPLLCKPQLQHWRDWLAVAVSAGPQTACILIIAANLTVTAKIPWDTVMFGDSPHRQPLPAGDPGEVVLCSLAWMPDGSALAVMDKWGNLALLDVHGTVHRLQQVANPAQQHQQAPEGVIARAAASSRRGIKAKLLPYAVWGPTRQTTAKRPKAFSVSAFCPDAVCPPTLAVSDGSYISLWSATPLQNALSIPEPLIASGHPGHHLASPDATLADKAGQQVLPSPGMTLILSPLGVSLGTVKRQDAPAFPEDKDLQDGRAVTAAPPAVLEHLKQGLVGLILRMIRGEAAPGGLTLLLFPAPHLKQLGASQPVASLALNGQQLRKTQQESSANLWQPDVAAGLLLLCRPESGAAAAFEVLADADQWQEAVYLAVACLANGCAQQAQLLAVMATRLGAHMQGLGAMPAHAGAPALANLLQALQAALESCSSAAASQVPHAASTGLQRLYAGLLQQALAVLLDSAAASFAALPVMAVADGRLSEPLNKHLLLHLLGQAILQTATTHGANPAKPVPINTAYICWQLARQEQLASILSMLAGVLSKPSLPSAFMTALAQLGSAAATLSDLAQEVGNALQTQGLLEEKDWEEVQDSLREPAAFTPDLVQLKQLQHQCDFVAYLRGIISILKPHLGLLAADAQWTQQLVDDGPSLSMSDDAPPHWGLPTHPFPTGSPLHFSSTPEDSKQHADNGLGTNQAGESQGVEGLDMSQTSSEALKGMIRLGWLLLCRARLSRAWRANLKHTQQALMTGSFEVSAQEQACAEDVVKWATALAAADGVHSSKEVQEGVIGACSSIRHPCPAVPALLESALPDAPIERAAAMMRRLKASCMDSVPHSTSSDEQGVADWQAEWGAYCSTTMSSLQAWLQSDSDAMAIMQEDMQGSQPNASLGTEDILGYLLSMPSLCEAGHMRLPPLSGCFQHPLCLGTGQDQGLDAEGALLALQSLLHPSANPQIRAWQQARVEEIPPQPAPSAVPLAAYDTISPADIDLSMTPLEVSQPKAETTGSLQSSSTAQTEAGQLRDASNQAEQLLIKAALKTGGLLPSQEGNGIRLEKGDIAGPQLRHVAFEQPLATQPISGVVASQAHDEWTVIQSDDSDTEYNSRSGAKQGLVRVKSALPQEELPQQLQGLGLLHTGPSRGPAGVKTLTDDSSQLFKSKLPALKAGCLNFGSHVVAKGQVAETQWGQSIGRKSKPRERSALDDAALSSEDSESEYEDDDEPRAQTQAHFEADNDAESASQSRMTSHDSQEHPAEGQYTDALPGQGQYEAGQYADYRSEEGQSEEGQYGEGHFDDTGLDQSLDVLPAGIISAPEVYSPMSCGAARVRSMITNRPFMLEEPMSPVAERRGATMRRGSQLALTAPAESLGSSVVAQGPQQQEEPLYRDWSQPVVQDLSATAAEPAAPAPMSEADLAAELAIADAMRKKGKKSDADAVKTGAIRKLTGSLFKRSGKKTAETQTTEYREEETQTSDQPEPPTETVGDILKMWAPLPKATTAGGPAQSASQLLRAMRLDRGLPNGREGLDRGLSKGREDLTERQQQTHMSMGGTPGRLTGQGHQARSADAQNMVSEGSTGSSRLPLNHPHAHGLRLLRLDPRQHQSGRDAHTGARGGDVQAVQERTQAAANQLRLLRLPVAQPPAPAAAPEQTPQPSKQPLQDANGRHEPPSLLPAPSYPPSQLRASSNTDHTVRSSTQALRSHEHASITVGSIANAYFGSAPELAKDSRSGQSEHQRRNNRSPPHYHEARQPGAPGNSCYDASIRVQRLGHTQQSPPASAEALLAPDHNRGNSQQPKRRQAALQQLAARSRSRSASSSRAVSQQPSRADLDLPRSLDHSLLNAALDEDAAVARLAGDYLAAVQSAASIHSSASSWPQQVDIPAQQQAQQGLQQGSGGARGNGVMGRDWEGVLRRGVELAQGPSTDRFLQVVDLYPEERLGQITGQSDWHQESSAAEQQPHVSKQRGMAAELADILGQLDDAARLADELDFGVGSRLH